MQLIPFRGAQEKINLRFKKNPDEKYFFIMENFDFLKIKKIPLVKNIFPI